MKTTRLHLLGILLLLLGIQTASAFYNPTTGRWLNRDPLGEDGGVNLYAFVRNDPLEFTDTDGRQLAPVLCNTCKQVALPGHRCVAPPQLSGTPGPDVTASLLLTLTHVTETFGRASENTKGCACLSLFTPGIGNGWDIYELRDLGFGGMPNFGPQAQLGTKDGARTVQFTYLGAGPKVYWAGAMNYALWGRMFRLCYHHYRDPAYSLSVAVGMARAYKEIFWQGSQARDASTFTELGYSASDPSGVALPLSSAPNNVAKPVRFEWQWMNLHAD